MKLAKLWLAGASLALLVAAYASIKSLAHRAPPKVGDVQGGRTLVPTGRWVKPEGQTTTLDDTITDALITPDGANVIVRTSPGISLLQLRTGKLLGSQKIKSGTSLTGLAISPSGTTIACTSATRDICLFSYTSGTLQAGKVLSLPAARVGGPSYPCGVQFLDDHRLVVAANRDNSIYVVNVDTGENTRIPVDTAPFGVAIEDPDHALVTCWARPIAPGAPTAPSSGTPVEVDSRGIGVGGSILRVNLRSGEIETRANTLGQPTEIATHGDDLYVACANGDAVLKLDRQALLLKQTLSLGKWSGTSPNSLAIDPAKSRLYVAFGGSDRIAAYDLNSGALCGLMQTAWYPAVVRTEANGGLLVATAKGFGSRAGKPGRRQVFQTTSTVSFEQHPVFEDGEESMPADSKAFVATDSIDSLSQMAPKPRPIPVHLGDPSVLKHVVYVIKENRTYDQVLGDMREGDGDPKLVLYGEKVTPNHHALAREFALLDNYYCNGVLSADGHAWATEANATDFFERSRGGWTRSYPFGDDPLATSRSGYLWDNALAHGRSVRNYGEFDYAAPDPVRPEIEIYHRFLAGEKLKFTQNIGVASLRAVSEPDYPGWNLGIPDVVRADSFMRHLREEENSGDMADLTILYLPQDHTAGGGAPTSRAQVADNDLALGRCIDAISHSRFWSSTVVFVTEDDPQAGFDHVDGHRSFCLMASPYVRRRTRVSEFYNQASVVHTIEQILGLPPMNKNDAFAPLMSECFSNRPDFTPYTARPNQIPLDETAGATAFNVPLDRPDLVDDDLFNRRLWALAGKKQPYPAEYAGAHGKGLAKRGLKLGAN